MLLQKLLLQNNFRPSIFSPEIAAAVQSDVPLHEAAPGSSPGGFACGIEKATFPSWHEMPS